MKIIGLTGRAGAGKDTVFRLLEEDEALLEERSVHREGFADILKRSAEALITGGRFSARAVEFCNQFKVEGRVMFKWGSGITEDTSISGREFLQRYGTESHRDVFGHDFWVEALMNKLDAWAARPEHPDLVVITDVRFDNEAIAIRDRGGEVWSVLRPQQDGGIADTHVSEEGLPGELIDGTILNDVEFGEGDSGLRRLKEQVEAVNDEFWTKGL